MKILAGLGNPGKRYAGTAHNLGFDVVAELARRWNLSFQLKNRFNAEVAEGQIAGVPVQLVRPQTFMNRSGESLAPMVRQRELAPDDLLVIVDDVNLPIGRLRIRPGGSHGGHNGLRSVIERLGHSDFARLRVGIQPNWEVDNLVDFVLSQMPPLEREQLAEMVNISADVAESWLKEGSAATADRYNGLRRFPPEA